MTLNELKEKVLKANDVALEFNNNKKSYSQIRKYYDELMNIKRVIEMQGESSFESHFVNILMIKSKVAYSFGRDKIHKKFKTFIDDNIDGINTFQDLKYFITYFEAVLGYIKYHEEVKDPKYKKSESDDRRNTYNSKDDGSNKSQHSTYNKNSEYMRYNSEQTDFKGSAMADAINKAKNKKK